MYSDKMINQMYYEKLNNLNARNRIQRELKYAVSEMTILKKLCFMCKNLSIVLMGFIIIKKPQNLK